MSEDIVKRLRVSSNLMTEWTHLALHGEAADEIERLRARVAVLEKHLALMICNNLTGSFESEGMATDRAIAALPDWQEKANGYTRAELDAADEIVRLQVEEAKP